MMILMPYIRSLDFFILHNCYFVLFDQDPMLDLCTTYLSFFFFFTLIGSGPQYPEFLNIQMH